MATSVEVVWFGGNFVASQATTNKLLDHMSILCDLNVNYLCNGTSDAAPTSGLEAVTTASGLEAVATASGLEAVTTPVLIPMIIPYTSGSEMMMGELQQHELRQLYGFLLSHFKLNNLTDLVLPAAFAGEWSDVAHTGQSACPLTVVAVADQGTITNNLLDPIAFTTLSVPNSEECARVLALAAAEFGNAHTPVCTITQKITAALVPFKSEPTKAMITAIQDLADNSWAATIVPATTDVMAFF